MSVVTKVEPWVKLNWRVKYSGVMLRLVRSGWRVGWMEG